MKETPNIVDFRLVASVKQDDHQAFDQLFHKYAKTLYSFLLSILKDENEAEEAVQDIFFKIWEKRKGLDPKQSFKAYLFTIAVNLSKNLYRKKLQEEKYKQKVAVELNFNTTSEMNEVEYKDLLNYLDKIINKLPPARREIFIMSRKMGLKNAEIAVKLNLSEQTIKNQLVTAQKFLRSEVAGSDNEIGLLFLLFFYNL